MSQNREVMLAVSRPGPVLVLVHDDIEPPVQRVLDTPVCAGDLVEVLGRERRAQQVIGCFGRGLGAGLAHAGQLADGGEAGPVVVLLQPVDVSRQRRRARFDASVIGIDGLRARRRLARRVVEKCGDVIMQRALVALERQDIYPAQVRTRKSLGEMIRKLSVT
jgi:hypothetical protein